MLSVVALLATAYIAPVASANHCTTKINVSGRISLAPVPPPPYTSGTAGLCLRVFGDAGIDEHLLPPNTDQVLVRVLGDYGASVPSVRVILNGLGFLNHEFRAYRTLNTGGGYSYNMPEWVALPDGPTSGNLTASVVAPGGYTSSVVYRTTLTVVPPPVPTIPPP